MSSNQEEHKRFKLSTKLLGHTAISYRSEAVEHAAEDIDLSQPVAVRKEKRNRQIALRYRDSLTTGKESFPVPSTEVVSHEQTIPTNLHMKYNSEQIKK